MTSIEVKQISILCKTRMRIPISVYEKYATVVTVCVYTVYVAHAAFCVYVWHGKGLRMRIVKNFEYGNLQRTNERFRWSKWHKRYSFPSGTPVSVMRKMEILPPRPVGSATIARHWRQAAVHVARVAERSAKNLHKMMLNIYFGLGKYGLLRRYH